MSRHAAPRQRWVRTVRRLTILAVAIVVVVVVAHLIPAAPRPSIGPVVPGSPTSLGPGPHPTAAERMING